MEPDLARTRKATSSSRKKTTARVGTRKTTRSTRRTTSTKKKKSEVLVSPLGIAAYCYLNKPDTGRKYSDDKYKATIKFPKEGADNQAEINKFVKKINKLHEATKPKGMGNESPIKDGDEKDDEQFHGHWYMRAKSDYQPSLVGKGRKKLPRNVNIFSGDIIRMAIAAAPYKNGNNRGLTLYLNAVKLIEKLNAGFDGAEAFDEDDDEGFDPDAFEDEEDEDDEELDEDDDEDFDEDDVEDDDEDFDEDEDEDDDED